MEEVKAVLTDWEDFYNNRRLHWGINLKTPKQIYREYFAMMRMNKKKSVNVQNYGVKAIAKLLKKGESYTKLL